MIAAVFAIDVLDHLLAPLMLEIDVDIRWLAPFRRDETLEQEIDAAGADIGDAEAIADDGIGRRAAALAQDGLRQRTRMTHDVVHGEEEGGVIELADHLQFVLQRGAHLGRCAVRKAVFQPGLRQRDQRLLRRAAGLALMRIVVAHLVERKTAAFEQSLRFAQRIAFIPVTSGSLSRRLFAHAVVVETLDALDRVRVHAPGIAAFRLPPPVAPDGGAPAREEIPARLGVSADAFHLLFDGPIERGNVLDHLARIVPYLLLAERRLHFHFRVRARTANCRAAAEAFYKRHLAAFCMQTSVHFEDEPARGLWDLADALFLPYERHAQDAEIPLAVLAAAAHGKPVFLLDRSPWADLGPHDLRGRVTATKDPDLGLRILDYVRDPGVVPGDVLRGHALRHFAAEVAVQKLREIAERTAAR